MTETHAFIRDVADTARWVATYRADESERPDALFRDPFARRLAGARGAQIGARLRWSNDNLWAWSTRTHLHDRIIAEQVAGGVDMVINLAAGLDTRPYRMDLPASLSWVEVDQEELLAYKADVLRDERPRCDLRRIPLDLADGPARRDLFDELGRQAKEALIVTEGFLCYLTAEEARSFALDLARPASFRSWGLDLHSPRALKMLQDQWNRFLDQGGAPLKFAPEEGTAFFGPCGWQTVSAHSLFRTAYRLKRLSFLMRLLALLTSEDREGTGYWAGVCLLRRRDSAPVA